MTIFVEVQKLCRDQDVCLLRPDLDMDKVHELLPPTHPLYRWLSREMTLYDSNESSRKSLYQSMEPKFLVDVLLSIPSLDDAEGVKKFEAQHQVHCSYHEHDDVMDVQICLYGKNSITMSSLRVSWGGSMMQPPCDPKVTAKALREVEAIGTQPWNIRLHDPQCISRSRPQCNGVRGINNVTSSMSKPPITCPYHRYHRCQKRKRADTIRASPTTTPRKAIKVKNESTPRKQTKKEPASSPTKPRIKKEPNRRSPYASSPNIKTDHNDDDCNTDSVLLSDTL